MANRLAEETSPYLRQHSENPVDWYPWGGEAERAARDRDVPILLSVGYSACHWCHVMAHESFEDAATAETMNRLFVNVKVDREERPDVDAIYMQAVQAITGQGGWPMTVFLTPDGRPFFGGTYFPKSDAQGRPGFVRVLEAVADAWSAKRAELLDQADRLGGALGRGPLDGLEPAAEGGVGAAEQLQAAYSGVAAQFEPRHGGFGRAPKFPQAMTLDFLLRSYVRNESPETLAMVTTSLDAMAAGGLYDQIGGGFHRYSVDDFWLVPHFEKMLYDQALLTGTFTRAFQVTGEPRYRRVVADTIEYVLRDLHDPAGGFLSAEDADSEGVEGKFYLWAIDEIRDVCGDDAPEVIRFFGVTERGNFVDPHTSYSGNILHAVDPTEDRPEAVVRAIPRLFAARARRTRPSRDDKVVLAWNGLMIRALAEAAAVFGRDDWLDEARRATDFCLGALRREDGRLLRSWQVDGGARHLAYAEDYAALLEALLTLTEVDRVEWLRTARAVASELTRLFGAEDLGFYTTGTDADPLIVRPRDVFDNATPSENSLAADGLLRLATLTGDETDAEPAARYLEVMGPVIAEHPTGFAFALGALERSSTPAIEVAVVNGAGARELQAEVFRRLIPVSVVVRADAGNGADLTPLLADRIAIDGRATAYVCERFACRQPVTDADALRSELDAALTARI